MARDVGESLEKLIAKLETRADEGLNRAVFIGRALSRNSESIHLAVPSGIVTIPLSEIEEYNVISQINGLVLSLIVRNAEKVKQMLTVPEQLASRDVIHRGQTPVGLRMWSVPEIIDQDTGTPSNGVEDRCDDWIL